MTLFQALLSMEKNCLGSLESIPTLTTVLVALSSSPDTISSDIMQEIEHFVIVMYSRTCPLKNINEARTYVLIWSKAVIRVPLAQAALLEHVKRAVYQGAHVWGNCLNPRHNYPDPRNCGWTMDIAHGWIPFWTALQGTSTLRV